MGQIHFDRLLLPMNWHTTFRLIRHIFYVVGEISQFHYIFTPVQRRESMSSHLQVAIDCFFQMEIVIKMNSKNLTLSYYQNQTQEKPLLAQFHEYVQRKQMLIKQYTKIIFVRWLRNRHQYGNAYKKRLTNVQGTKNNTETEEEDETLSIDKIQHEL